MELQPSAQSAALQGPAPAGPAAPTSRSSCAGVFTLVLPDFFLLFLLLSLCSCSPLCVLCSDPACHVTVHSHPSRLRSKVTSSRETFPEQPVPTGPLSSPLPDFTMPSPAHGYLVCIWSVSPGRTKVPPRTEICLVHLCTPGTWNNTGQVAGVTKYVLVEGRWVLGRPKGKEEKREYLSNLNSKGRLLSGNQPQLIKGATNFVQTSLPCRPLTLE